MNSSTGPPYYVFVSQSSLCNDVPGPLSASLAHPVIEYHYADDSPLSLLPRSPDERVIIMDYDPSDPSRTSSRSISRDVAVTATKTDEAPGAAAADEEFKKNSGMFILEITSTKDDKTMAASEVGDEAPEAILARFKHRNAIIRRVLEQPDTNLSSINSPTANYGDNEAVSTPKI